MDDRHPHPHRDTSLVHHHHLKVADAPIHDDDHHLKVADAPIHDDDHHLKVADAPIHDDDHHLKVADAPIHDDDHHLKVADAPIHDDDHHLKLLDATAPPTPRDHAIAAAAAHQQQELPTHGLPTGSTRDNRAVQPQEVQLEQGVVALAGVGLATQDDTAVDRDATIHDHNYAIAVDAHHQEQVKPLLEQCTSTSTSCEDLGTPAMDNDDDAVQLQEVMEQQHATHPRDEYIAAEEQSEMLDRELGSTEKADAVPVQEAAEQGLVGTDGESADATAVDGHDMAVEQCVTCHDLGTTTENDGAKDDQEQGVIDQGDAAIDGDNDVKHHKVLVPGAVEGTHTSSDDIAVEDQGKNVEQCTTYDVLGTTMKNDDAIAVDDQQVVEQGVVDLTTIDDDPSVEEQEVVEQGVVDLTTMDDDPSVEEQEVVEQGVVDLTTMDDDPSVEDHEVLQQGIIGGTVDIAVQKQEKPLEQCSRATKDEYTAKEKEMVVEQGVIDPKYMDIAMEDQDKLLIIDDQDTVPMDDIVVKDHDKAVVEYASDAIVSIKDESPVEEHDTVGSQGVIDKNGRTKDDIDVEGHGYVKELVIIDKWGTSSDAAALEGQKNETEPCIGDEQIAGKDMDGVHAEANMLEQMTGDKQGATLSDFAVDKHKDVVERVRHEWGAPENDLAMDTAAYQGTRDWGIVNKEKYRAPARRYPQKPRKLNCPSYMSKGTCTYGPSCHFNHPPQFNAKTNDSWRPSERRDHGAAEILELNRLGLPIREGARNCDYYMRTGACRYGKNCHFNHPDHVIDARFSSPTGWEDNALETEKSSDHALTEASHMKKASDDATLNDRSHLKKSSDGATLDDRSHLNKSSDNATLDDRSHLKRSSDGATVDDTSYSKKSSDHDTSSTSGVLPPSIFRMLLPPQKVLPSTEGKAKKKSDWSSASDDSDGCCSADSSDGPLCKQEEHVDYPERPGRQECPFLARYGDCKFASACKYHHPKQSKDKEQVNYPERPGRPDCPFYMRFGDCKFASACNYHHPKDKYPTGLPEEPECPFYMKRGFCKFGAQCKFYHPEDANPTMQSPTDAKISVTMDKHHPSTRITPEDHVPQQPQYPERRSVTTDDHHPSIRITPEVLPQQPQYPERPGQPDCRYYMQFGKCKYLSACIFHHPKDRLAAMWSPSDPAHSDQIGPKIHGMPDCPFYMKSGKCQFGSLCEFRHPKDIYSTTEEAFGERTGSGAYDSLTRSDNGVEQQEGSVMYPERPGEPECAHYMRQGYCKFQMNCKYHHPGDRLSKKPTTRLATELVRTGHLSKAGTRWLPHECYQRRAALS
ncbi:uncharacterized protein LOC123452916 isoform X1 [Hordeum vulgare subsp. vulgare]|uniref:uncharacterized protein LOC123452916 isoform X1 n=1 Tax=Hordeum vulgare subsp. vulgare TaxID=112509 RepID=UPI001D1A5A24|nr:uncharacterized protein LOC123452916 isoform X1 [Hordeum vulgare subsp. vulgare]